jgi:hypothetical protein
MRPLNYGGLGALLVAAAVALGCDSSTSPTKVGTGTTFSLTTTAVAAMDRAIQDEYHAEQIYEGVLEDFGALLPFANVVRAEARHSESIARVYWNHEMAVPASAWSRDNVPRFQSVPEACAAAVLEEEKNIAMYDELLREELPLDVRTVFSSNRDASLSSHLPAFQRCAG